jgi:hypothetical protein
LQMEAFLFKRGSYLLARCAVDALVGDTTFQMLKEEGN